jgi:outer membrane lipoprotein-sorting protein
LYCGSWKSLNPLKSYEREKNKFSFLLEWSRFHFYVRDKGELREMKKSLKAILAGLFLISILAACGEKTEEDVVVAIKEKLENMTGYKTNAKMTLQTGEAPQEYNVEVWHKKDKYYRVHLKSDKKKEHSQMILRNDEGVFVLTPALNKSFRFESSWPENISLVYLYESLMADVLNDSDKTFKMEEDTYVFKTKTNYTNKILQHQVIKLDKDLKLISVEVMDKENNVLVKVDFSNFKFSPKYDNDAFDLQKNMTSAAVTEEEQVNMDDVHFAIHYPVYAPQGSVLKEQKEVMNDQKQQVVLIYGGEKSFTLIQEKSRVMPAMGNVNDVNGSPVDLGFVVGAMTDNSISWTYNGIDFFLASDELSQDEMISIARSVFGNSIK